VGCWEAEEAEGEGWRGGGECDAFDVLEGRRCGGRGGHRGRRYSIDAIDVSKLRRPGRMRGV
jgi:hypothetical protein